MAKTLKDLKAIAKELKIPKYYNMRKDELLEVLAKREEVQRAIKEIKEEEIKEVKVKLKKKADRGNGLYESPTSDRVHSLPKRLILSLNKIDRNEAKTTRACLNWMATYKCVEVVKLDEIEEDGKLWEMWEMKNCDLNYKEFMNQNINIVYVPVK